MAEEKKESQAKKMYGHSPKLERDEGGKMSVKKKSSAKETDKKEGEDEAGSGDTLPVTVRHGMDRLSMHHKHESEHMAHKDGDKHEMHERHRAEMATMHKAHEKEMGKEKET